MESSQPTALRGQLIAQPQREPGPDSLQSSPAQVRWLRQDLESLTSTVSDVVAARDRIVFLLGALATEAEQPISACVERSPRSAASLVYEDRPVALHTPPVSEPMASGSSVSTQAPYKTEPRSGRAQPVVGAPGLPRIYANGLVAIGLMLITAAISFTIV